VNPYLLAIVWAMVGAAAGWFVRWGSVKLARLEGLDPDKRLWQVYGPPLVSAILFAVFAFETHSFWLLVLHSLFVLVLVQVIFFDLEHRLILDRVMFPSIVAALIVSLFRDPWWAGLATGLAVGVLFVLIAVVGSLLFKTEAMGFGDVKLALFIGLLLGWPYTVQALFYGVLLAGLAAVLVIIWRRSSKGSIAYGPYLAAGALIMLLQLP
jgi:prepilin signal peptidase PulO-like enzyme (type II secretory pathway)